MGAAAGMGSTHRTAVHSSRTKYFFANNGTSWKPLPAVESNAFYLYDEQGIARWALGAVSPFGATTMPLMQYRNGFCPLCAFTTPTTVQVGTLTRRYDTAAAGNIAVALQLQSPLNGSWNVDLPAVKLTDGLQCQ